MVHVPAVRVEDVREIADVAVMPRHDLQDGLRLVVLEGDPPRDLAHLPHAVEDLDAPSDRGQLAERRMQEERRPGPRVLDAMRAVLVPEPEDHRVAVVVGVGVDDPAVREDSPGDEGNGFRDFTVSRGGVDESAWQAWGTALIHLRQKSHRDDDRTSRSRNTRSNRSMQESHSTLDWCSAGMTARQTSLGSNRPIPGAPQSSHR